MNQDRHKCFLRAFFSVSPFFPLTGDGQAGVFGDNFFFLL